MANPLYKNCHVVFESLQWKPRLLQIPLNLFHKGGHIFPENVPCYKILINRFQSTKSMDLKTHLASSSRLQIFTGKLVNCLQHLKLKYLCIIQHIRELEISYGNLLQNCGE